MEEVIGEYLIKADPKENEKMGLWERFNNRKAQRELQGHFVAIANLVDHMDIDDKSQADERKDCRRTTEDAFLVIRNNTLKLLSKPVGLINNKAAEKLKWWASDEYKKLYTSKMEDPNNADKYSHTAYYIAKNLHEFGPLTKTFSRIADLLQCFNINIVLSMNSQLSRISNCIVRQVNQSMLSSPVSRTMCTSMGRGFGGAALAAATAFAVPAIFEVADQSTSFNIPAGGDQVNVSWIVTGIAMFLISVPTLAFTGLAIAASHMEGWYGRSAPALPPSNKRLDW